MEAFLLKAGQLVAALSLLVIIHEFGHYMFARIFGIRVDKFFLFFNPWFYLVKYNPKTKKWSFFKDKKDASQPTSDALKCEKATWRDTEYGIGWLPLGGYVQIAGMIDETQDASKLSAEPQPWEFRTKPAWQRLLVMVGGVLFNFLLAIVIYAGITYTWGEQYIEFDKATAGMAYVETAKNIGFQDGDIPLLADGEKVDITDHNHIMKMVEAKTVTVLRNGTDTVNIAIPDNFLFQLNDEKGFFTYRVPVHVAKVVNGEAAEKAGLQDNDQLVSIAGVATPSYTEFTAELLKNAGKEVEMGVIRNGESTSVKITPNEAGKVGIQLKPITDIYPTTTIDYTFLQSIPKGIEMGCNQMVTYVSSLKHLFTAEGAQSLGGFGAIGDLFPESWSWYKFWTITAFLSVILAFMNILPIPALDGGHVLFTLYEIITRRKPSEKFLEYAQTAGMLLLFALLIYANANDIYRFFIK
ncbi:MAG: RIP metalloprotease RseP [Muribaculaceae bacterium]|nr:RIP metalloprotease RseP [Muribaculaceae bacterium]